MSVNLFGQGRGLWLTDGRDGPTDGQTAQATIVRSAIVACFYTTDREYSLAPC